MKYLKYLIFFLILIPNQVLAQAKFYQVQDSDTPGITVVDASRANLTERSLIGIRLNRRPIVANSCGEIPFTWNQYNVGREISIVANGEQGNDKVLDLETLPNPSTLTKNASGCWSGDSKALNRIIATGLTPNKPYIVEEKIQNYRNVRYNTCGIANVNTENLVSYQANGTLYFDLAGKQPATPEALEALFEGTYTAKPICYKEIIYVPVIEAN
jgi:hypothetical protein